MAEPDAPPPTASGERTGPKPALPGNQGQFGTADATEEYKRMEDAPPASSPAPSPVEDARKD